MEWSPMRAMIPEGGRSLQHSANVNKEVGDEISRIWQDPSRNDETTNLLPKTAKLLPKRL